MVFFLVAFSIVALTGFVWRLNLSLKWNICPICAGVAGTWAWMLCGILFGILPRETYLLPTALLLGGSIVGVAYVLEQKLPKGTSLLLWKTVFIPLGFAATYAILEQYWLGAAGLLAALGATTVFFLKRSILLQRSDTTNELEEKMKNCC